MIYWFNDKEQSSLSGHTSLIYTQNKLLLNILALRKMIKIILILHDKDNINFTIKDLYIDTIINMSDIIAI